ncbi:MAG: family 20 glycosylhydrolase [Pseudomonadota bacterium]
MPTTHPDAPIAVEWECLSNLAGDGVFTARLILTNVSAAPIAPGWQLCFNACRKVMPGSVSAGFAIEHLNGDLFRLTASADAPWAPGQAFEIAYRAEFWVISMTDAPLGFYLLPKEGGAIDLGDPRILPFARVEQRMRHAEDRVPPNDAAQRYADNAALHLLPAHLVGRITPRPVSARFGTDVCRLGRNSVVVHEPGLGNEAAFLRAILAMLPPVPDGAVQVMLETGPVALDGVPQEAAGEAYLLDIGTDAVRLRGAAAHGVFNALQSLRQLVDADGRLPTGRVLDAPRFAHRGMMLDVARHFAGVETVLRLLDCMASYKLNRFHFHLTDDEGWRLPITALPELTEVGARRGVSIDGRLDDGCCLPPSFGSGADIAASPGSGHYSHEDFIAILRHAHARHIEVIPEFNMPGHARAAVLAMRVRHDRLLAAGDAEGALACRLDDPDDTSVYESVQLWRDNVICIALPSVDRFVDTVVAEVKELYRRAGVPLRAIHTGGDEVPNGAWLGSPLCRARMAEQGWLDVAQLRSDFVARCRAILARHGLAFAGWDDTALTHEAGGAPAPAPRFAGPDFHAYVWNNAWGSGQEDIAYRLANAGYSVVLANAANLYFDLACAKDPEEPGYYWAGFVDLRQAFAFCPLDQGAVPAVDAMGRPMPEALLARLEKLEGGRIAGLQGQLWGENAHSRARIEYLVAPRLLALAERAWSPDPGWRLIADPRARARRIDADWNEFANRLGQRELPRLDRAPLAYGYRLPPPGLQLRDGEVRANVALPGLALRYRFDGADPDADSPRYTGPLAVPPGAAAFTIASFDTRGRRSRSATIALKDADHA